MAPKEGHSGDLIPQLKSVTFKHMDKHIIRTYLLAALQQPERDVLEESCNIIVNIIL